MRRMCILKQKQPRLHEQKYVMLRNTVAPFFQKCDVLLRLRVSLVM